MNVKVFKSQLNGKVEIPYSKSQLIRAIICAGLSSGVSNIKGISMCDDVMVAINAIKSLGANVRYYKDEETMKSCLIINGRKHNLCNKIEINFKESATVYRIFLSIIAVLGIEAKFIVYQSLKRRYISDLTGELIKHGITYDSHLEEGYVISKGKISGEDFFIRGNITSQFISGLLIAIPLIEDLNKEAIKIYLLSEIKSKQYVNMTLDMISKFGIKIDYDKNKFIIHPNQKYRNTTVNIEGDYSIGANFLVSKSINSKGLIIENLPTQTLQSDKLVLDVIDKIEKGEKININADDCMDIVPILVVLFYCKDVSAKIYNAKRLMFKESNRLEAICESLIKMGANIEYNDNEIIVKTGGVLKGGVLLSGYNDHRIIMALTIAGMNCDKPVIISDARSVNKSYPEFWDVIKKLGAKFEFVE